MADPQLVALMAANLKKQAGKQEAEEVIVASGDVAAGQKPKQKKKPPPGAQQIGMQAMLLQEATKKGNTLKATPKTWGVQQPDLKK
ncbi:expressed unknown protein [Seminavis robusta]|uniref:Uncharacterized protein n=1 Tax=Seminavis robusta TaxID=568900 RepID=A0A9N8EBL4_9STRA|nr:expressed unknown protein [Seminavis robusta]|eukprot:Sro847_g210390.1 n/a (86) ;mRNA; r:43534-43791